MSFGPDAKLFGDFAFEHVERLAFCRQRRIGFRCLTAGQQQLIRPQDRQQVDPVLGGISEELNNLAPVGDDIQG
ncbi:MAG: hypothetical protein PVJ56_09630, partial [Desulfobacterales bacterium]